MTERLGEYSTFDEAASAHTSGDCQYIQHDGYHWVLFRDSGLWGTT